MKNKNQQEIRNNKKFYCYKEGCGYWLQNLNVQHFIFSEESIDDTLPVINIITDRLKYFYFKEKKLKYKLSIILLTLTKRLLKWKH